MTADDLLSRLVSTLPEALGAWVAAWAGLRLLRVRDPRIRAAVWMLAAVDSLLPLAGAGSIVLVTARIAVAPGAVPEVLGSAGPAILAATAAVSGLLAARRVAAALRLESAADSLAALWPVAAEPTCLDARLASPPGGGTPFVAGLLRPVVVFPAALWSRLDGEARRAVLLHESAHLRRLDGWRALAEGLASDLLWFNPLVRLLFARAQEEREALADRDAVRRGADRAGLARAIVAAATLERAPAGALAFSGRRGGSLERRLELLRDRGRGCAALAQGLALVLLLPWSPGAAENGVQPARGDEIRGGERGRVLLGLAWRANPLQSFVLGHVLPR